MPVALPTLLDIASSTGSDGIAGLIEEVVAFVPEIQIGAARTIKGMQYKATIRTQLPTTGFRGPNKGAKPTRSRYEQRLFDCFVTDTPWLADKALADIHEDGAAAYIAAEARGIVQAQTIMLGKQFYYGLDPANAGFSDANGFPGLAVQYDAATMTVDAGGSTANTGSSVWAVSWGEDGVQWLYGNGSNPLQLTDVQTVVLPDINDPTSGNMVTYYHQQLLAWVGMKQTNARRVARIKNLTAQAGKGLTDNLLRDLVQSFNVGYRPDAIFMSRRSMGQWIKSRTPVGPTANFGPQPTVIADYDGIPVIQTDSIQNTEAII
ncbi:MAG: hypothetical protein U0941_30000 [Planctomycetaceae bacterium]